MYYHSCKKLVCTLFLLSSISISFGMESGLKNGLSDRELQKIIDIKQKYNQSDLWWACAENLEKEGMDIDTLSKKIIHQDQYSIFWGDALHMRCFIHKENRFTLAKELLKFVERDEKIYTKEIREAKTRTLSLLLDIVRSACYHDETVRHFINTEIQRFCSDDCVTIDYWMNRFSPYTKSDTPIRFDTNPADKDDPFIDAKVAARMCLYMNFELYKLTGDSLYKDRVIKAKESKTFSKIASMLMSQEFIPYWEQSMKGHGDFLSEYIEYKNRANAVNSQNLNADAENRLKARDQRRKEYLEKQKNQ